MKIAKTLLLVAFALFWMMQGCEKSSQEEAKPTPAPKKVAETKPEKLRVVATVGMIADLARRIAGEHATVDALMGPGTDPHLYKAREKDIRALSKADVIFYNGLHLEGKLGDVLDKMARKKTVTAVAGDIPREKLREPVAGGHDPHVWFNVELWMFAAEKIRDVLAEKDPSHKAEYRTNAEKLLKEMKQLHEWTHRRIASIAKERRVLITAHDAFGYFGDAYDIDVMGVQGISTEDEAGVKDINRMVSLIVDKKIKAVFVESSVSQKNVEALVEGCRAKGHELAIGGELFSDAMGAADTPGGTYIGMVRHNVDTIVNALK